MWDADAGVARGDPRAAGRAGAVLVHQHLRSAGPGPRITAAQGVTDAARCAGRAAREAPRSAAGLAGAAHTACAVLGGDGAGETARAVCVSNAVRGRTQPGGVPAWRTVCAADLSRGLLGG